jgi:uncharacterized membrane protein YfcA
MQWAGLSGVQWLLAATAAFLVGLSKTGIAGLGVLAVALFASALPPRESTGIVLIVLIGADIVAVVAYRREVSWPHLLRLFPWAALGIVLGFLVMGRIDAQVTQRLIGAILVVLMVIQMVRRVQTRQRTAPPEAAQVHPIWAALTGVSAGFTTMVANAAGPIMIVYLLAMRLPKLVFMGTSAWYFFVLNVFKVPFSYSLGLVNLASLRISLALIPFAVLGAVSGRVLIRYIDQGLFELLAIGLTLLAGLRLLFG